jgi:hypothetical protein
MNAPRLQRGGACSCLSDASRRGGLAAVAAKREFSPLDLRRPSVWIGIRLPGRSLGKRGEATLFVDGKKVGENGVPNDSGDGLLHRRPAATSVRMPRLPFPRTMGRAAPVRRPGEVSPACHCRRELGPSRRRTPSASRWRAEGGVPPFGRNAQILVIRRRFANGIDRDPLLPSRLAL